METTLDLKAIWGSFYLKVPLDIDIWISNTFDNNGGIRNDFRDYLKERDVGSVLSTISPAITFTGMLSLKRYHLICQAAFGFF